MVSSLVFNRSAASRLLGCKPEAILKFEVWASVIFIHIKGQRPTFLSKKRFYSEFASFRKEGAKLCKVEAPLRGYPKQYEVISEGTDKKFHTVWMNGIYQSCDCRDFEEQKAQNFPQPCCKHQYAVLNHLNCSSIEAAMAKGQQQYQDFLEAEAREAAPVIKPPVQVAPVKLPAKYAHISVI